MVTFACPWCEHEVIVAEGAEREAQVRCEDCATIVDLAPAVMVEPPTGLPLAA